ncbi:gamma-glutamylcyclotransferase family protein [Streptomyces sp. NRRL B-1347]|uniref:gamma-glutamylcyclotransferase family protein n=1 Tax=Streptomyces sp. NRRL B-1347 TaxID=1476877 RepID=UPI00099B4142|nr:gamma-glutamylcyclotransferase family protein [Streptomyces sp. NRRL B-1347]
MTERLPFFVYGTLRPGQRNHAFLHGRVLTRTPARLPDAVLYDGPGYPYAVRTPGAGPVHGDLLTARPETYGRLLADLDHLEEYVPGDPRSLYLRVARDVVREDGTTARAWVYVAGPQLAARLRATATPLPGNTWPVLDRITQAPPGGPRTP